MGRLPKRVPIDFNWPIGQPWKGAINPFPGQDCKACDQSGYNKATKELHDSWYSLGKHEWIYPDGKDGRRWNNAAWDNHITDLEVEALVKAGRISDLMDKWYAFDEGIQKWTYLKEIPGKPRQEWEWTECDKPVMPTANVVNEWNRGPGFGHDSINAHICVKARAKHLGVYGKCEICEGEGTVWQTKDIKKLHDEWEPFEPPIGDGFQLWQNTSEDSPMSPVFETLELLCEYLADNKASVFGKETTTKAEWIKMLDSGHVYHQSGNAIFI